MANIFPDGFEEMNENERQDWFNNFSINGLREFCKISIDECTDTKEQLAEATLEVNSLLQANADLLQARADLIQSINQLHDRNMVLLNRIRLLVEYVFEFEFINVFLVIFHTKLALF